MRILAIALAVLFSVPALAAGLKSDERALFFPTQAALTPEGVWIAPLHALVYEPEADSPMRATFLKALEETIGDHWSEAEEKTFRERAMLFLIDRERGKTIEFKVGDAAAKVGPSWPDGHARGEAVFHAEGRWLKFGDAADKGMGGEIELVAQKGVTVVSDIDDTIKITNVPNRFELLRNTFLRPFSPVTGMAGAYSRWAEAGASFVYVSGTPWELYPTFRAFLDANNFPRGAVELRQIDYDPAGIRRLAEPPVGLKGDALEKLFARFPDRTFYLVGDSGERDPEIYGKAAREHPRKVAGVFIRDVTGEGRDAPRYAKAFAGVAPTLWQVFLNPDELPADLTQRQN